MRNRSPAELIAMATGRRGAAAHADAHRLVEKLGLKKLADAGAAEIREVCRGMTPEAVQRLMAGVEIGLRIAELKTEYEASPRITSPATAIRFCLDRFGRLARESKQEEFWIVTLNTKNEPIDCHQITVGTLRNSLVHPREVFRPAIRDAANCILVMHNHPSGERHQRFERIAFVFDVLVNGQLPADRFQATAGHNHGLIRSLALNRH
jgi:DNA repair protein RadC